MLKVKPERKRRRDENNMTREEQMNKERKTNSGRAIPITCKYSDPLMVFIGLVAIRGGYGTTGSDTSLIFSF